MKLLLSLLAIITLLSCGGQKNNPLNNTTIAVNEKKASTYIEGVFEYDNIHSGLMDNEGNLWFATSWKAGVFKYDGKHFTCFSTKDGLLSNDVSCIYKDVKGNLWFGTDIGPCRYDGNHFVSFPFSKGPKGNVAQQIADGYILSQQVTCIQEDNDGNVWFGTNEGAFHYKNGKFLPYIQVESINGQGDKPNNRITNMIKDRKGDIWFGSWSRGGLTMYDGKNFIPVSGLNDDMIASILEDRKGNIWIGTRNHGVSYFNGEVIIDISKNEALSKNCVYDILEDKQGNIWFATESTAEGGHSGGAWCYDGSKWKQFTTKDGLINNHVFCIVEDAKANLWFGTRGGGLCRYDGESFTNFSNEIFKK